MGSKALITTSMDQPSSCMVVRDLGSANGGCASPTGRSPLQEYQGNTATVGHPSYIKKIAAGPLLTDDGSYMVSALGIHSGRERAW